MLNSAVFYILAALTLFSAIAAMLLRNMVHCVLCIAAAFAGIALIYLQLDAEFVGFAQIVVYIGAVAILALFAVLLTRGAEVKSGVAFLSKHWPTGLAAMAVVFAAIAAPILMSPSLKKIAPENASIPVQKIGYEMMTHYALPLEAIGLLLTAGLLGAVVVAMHETTDYKPESKMTKTKAKEIEGAKQ
jgi:NADH-quinone oxidoreductase subunit J